MLRRTEGIVLRTIPFGEADLVVTYLTPDFGLLKTFAKSPRKIKSRFGSSLEPITHSRISFWGKEDASLPRLTQSDIIHSFHSIRDSLACFLKVLEIIELTLNFIPERDANRKVYSLLLNTLHDIENQQNGTNSFSSHANAKDNISNPPFAKGGEGGLSSITLLINHYKIKFLRFVGFAPKLEACGRCGKGGNCFYISHGSILCEDCAKGLVSTRTEHDSSVRLSPAFVKLYSNLLTWDTTKIKRIKPSDTLLSELSSIIDMHIRYILTKPLKSGAFIHSLPQRL